ncbi:MAG: hypothetical protein PHQ09_05640 [Actinomycetota bacterium]|nr:hypothetical protein [Actinomycetota bacterium]
MKRKSLILLLPVLILMQLVMGCRPVDEQAISFADQAAEKYLIALNDQDYSAYKEDMDAGMLEAVTEEEFIKFSSYLKENAGEYIPDSKKYSGYTTKNENILVIYRAGYTLEKEGVVVTTVISKSSEGTYKISGSWFDSPKLREAEYK